MPTSSSDAGSGTVVTSGGMAAVLFVAGRKGRDPITIVVTAITVL